MPWQFAVLANGEIAIYCDDADDCYIVRDP